VVGEINGRLLICINIYMNSSLFGLKCVVCVNKWGFYLVMLVFWGYICTSLIFE
jgi:hypothetical protein